MGFLASFKLFWSLAKSHQQELAAMLIYVSSFLNRQSQLFSQKLIIIFKFPLWIHSYTQSNFHFLVSYFLWKYSTRLHPCHWQNQMSRSSFCLICWRRKGDFCTLSLESFLHFFFNKVPIWLFCCLFCSFLPNMDRDIINMQKVFSR